MLEFKMRLSFMLMVRIEILSKHHYNEMMNVDADDFAELAEDVMGDKNGGDDE